MPDIDITVTLYDRTKSREYGGDSKSITTGAEALDARLVEIGTSEESIAFLSDITAGNGPGYLYIKNWDDTNYVEVGFATGVYPLRIDAGWSGLIPLNASGADTLYLKANTAAVEVEIYCQER